jgi:PadR family transcriptional regulator PadR
MYTPNLGKPINMTVRSILMSINLSRGDVPTLILAVLNHSPLHGYAIARAIEQWSVDALHLREGTLYPALRQLEEQGVIQSAWEVQEPGPARRVYSLTELGQAELARRIEAWESYSAAINAVLNPRRTSYG